MTPGLEQLKRLRLGCRIITFNEEDRIGDAIDSALSWADEVIVIDKHSTDNTYAICTSKGCNVGRIRFSQPGGETLQEIHESIDKTSGSFPRWYVAITPSDILKEDTANEIRDYISNERDGFTIGLVRAQYYSFGVTGKNNPWSECWTPRVLDRTSGHEQGKSFDPHSPYSEESAKHAKIKTTHPLIHQTHSSVFTFLRSHTSYAKQETQAGAVKAKPAVKSIAKFVILCIAGRAEKIQVIGYVVYVLMKWMYSIERASERDIKTEYAKRLRASVSDANGEHLAGKQKTR